MIARDGTIAGDFAEGFPTWAAAFDALDAVDDVFGEGEIHAHLGVVAAMYGVTRQHVWQVSINRAIMELAR